MRMMFQSLALPLGTCLMLAATAAPLGGAEPAAIPRRSAFYMEGNWQAREGGVLPFRSDAEAIAFLQTAEVVASEEIPGTSGRPLKMVMEKDGVQARAIFRTIDVERARMDNVQEHARGFRDHYVYEVAAYELSRLLGEAGFEIERQTDRTEFALEFFHRLRKQAGEGPPSLGLHILMGEDFPTKVANMVRNVEESRCAPWEIVCRRR